METLPDVKAVERRVYLSYHHDGLIDIFIGMVFLSFGIVTITGKTAFAGLCWMPSLLIVPMKRWITVPRLGAVQISRSGKVWIAKALMVTLSTGVLFLFIAAGLFHAGGVYGWMRRYFFLLFGASLAVIPLAGGVALGIRRFFAYAAALLAGFAMANFSRGSIPAVFIVLGSILILTGLAVLIRFLRRYPLPPKGDPS